MEPSLALCVVAMFAISCVQDVADAQVSSGSCNTSCGFLAVCENATCVCSANYVLHSNGRDCRNASCSLDDCLQCESTNTCKRCESFLSVSSGHCIKKCEGSAEINSGIMTCSESKDDDDGVNIVVAIVSGVAAGAVLCIIVIIAACIYIRKTRRNVNLQNKNYNRQMEGGHMKQFPTYDNKAYEIDNQTAQGPGKIDPLEYASELDKLRPHADTLMELLSQVRSKTRAMDASDERVPTYKGVIHQLCRVLVLVHKRDPVVSIPSDALGLIHWAHQMLEDHKEQQNSSGEDSPDFPIAQISCVDLDFDNPSHPVYATPERTQLHDSSASSLQGVATPYSTVPVPLTESEHQQHYGTGKRPGFATISRARAKPNSDLIRALEAELNNTDSVSVIQEPVPVLQNPSSGFRREDLQNFLIHTAEKSDFRNALNHTIERSQQTASKPLVTNNQSSDQNLNSELKEKLKNRINKPQAKSPFLISAQQLQSNHVTEDLSIGSQQSTKKNIITNPNVIKKSNSQSSKHSKYATPNFGYFANGRYYDPNPMPNSEAEVYAPGSSYSDHSNAMSTFLGDLPRSRSASSSDQSEDGDDESENSGGDLDVFPFDPKDCTEPVEV